MSPVIAAAERGETRLEAERPGAPGHRPHGRMAVPGIIRFVVLYLLEFAISLPAIFALRAWYRQAKAHRPEDPMVACIGENLDEVNGIAISSRIMLREMRALGKEVFIFGTAFHAKQPRAEGPNGSVVMASGRYSMDQA